MDYRDSDLGDVFAIPDLWCPSKLLSGAPDTSLLFSQLDLVDIDTKLPEIVEQLHYEDAFFNIPDLSFGSAAASRVATPIPWRISPEDSCPAEQVKEEETDIWLLPSENSIPTANYQTWEGFEKQRIEECHTPYLAEAGPSILDTVIAAREDFLRIKNTEYVVIDSKKYASSLLALGLGRSSIFFTWNDKKRSFTPTISLMRVSGYTGNSLDGLLTMFMDCGNITRYLQDFVDKAYYSTKSPSRAALAHAVSTLLATIQSRLSASAAEHNSILQLQALFRPAHSILTCFRRIIVNTTATRSDESMLSTIFEEIQLLEHRTDSLREILLEILSRVSQPWLEFAGEWLGLKREVGLPITKKGPGKSFVTVDNKEWVDDQGLKMLEPDYILDCDKIPAFIAPEDARAMFEVGRSLRLLRSHHADHPLSRTDVVAFANPPQLEWRFSWQDIVQVETKALQYEQDLVAALRRFSKDSPPPGPASLEAKSFECDFFGRPEEDMQTHFLATMDTFDQPFNCDGKVDCLSLGLNTYLASSGNLTGAEESVFAPPISLAPALSFNPIIAAQARIVNGTCMRMFFSSHKLREHLSIQRSFHLLGNGVFSSRLSHALFDPELESAERHRGVARSGGVMGLRLGGRQSWPPASSELRLALMGVLSDSYLSSQPLKKSCAGPYLDQSTIPGDLSFAVRDMSSEEIKKCINADSIEALDFLRLSYKPPQPLEAIITPIILFKYDKIFKLLLRIIRMLCAVSMLFRDTTAPLSNWQGADHVSQKFRIEAHHFITSVSGYFFDTGIESTWRIFERKLDQIEERIQADGEYTTLGQNEGLDKLRDYHEKVLDKIMFALLLRKRQQPVMKLLEEIFTLILRFSKHSRERALGMKYEAGANDELKGLYTRFRKKVGVFITVCRGLSEKKGYGERKMNDSRAAAEEGLFDEDDLAEENTIIHLLTKLEMSNYYSRSFAPLTSTTMRRSLRQLAAVKPSRFLEAGTPTGLTGLLTHPAPRSALVYLYTSTLEKLKVFPESSLYRQSTEAVINHRLAIVTAVEPEGYKAWAEKAKKTLAEHPEVFNTPEGQVAHDGGRHVGVTIGGKQFVISAPEKEYDERIVEWDGEKDEVQLEGSRTSAERKVQESWGVERPGSDIKSVKWDPEPALTADQISEIENKIGAGLIEEVIHVAEGELKLVDVLAKSKVWEDLEEKPVEGQWTYFKRDTGTGETQQPPQ
ncbi:Spc97/Spc98 family protein [Diplocarpon rosae]|nr:Spc97/Spc98 family protein [Diplocarpon rosae]